MPGRIYAKTLRDLRGQTAAWSAGLAVLAAANVLLYPSVQGMPDFITFLDHLPPALKAMIGDVRAMAELPGFLRIKFFDPLPLLLAIFVVSQGANLIAGEVEQKSCDLLLARPVRRSRVVLEKFLALLTATAFMTLAAVPVLMVCVRIIGDDMAAGYLLTASLNSLPLTWVFAGVAILGSCVFPSPRRAGMLGAVIVVGGYVFETLRVMSTTLRPWDEVSLFAWQKESLTLAGELHAGPVLLLLGLAVLLAGAAAFAFERRDLKS